MSETAPSSFAAPRIVDLTSVAHEGKVIVVGTGADGVLHYSVRQSGFEDTALEPGQTGPATGFEPWRPVPFNRSVNDPSVTAAEARSLVDEMGNPVMRSRYDTGVHRSAVGRAKLVSGLGHLYLFRVSTDRTLLMNRFLLDGMTNELVPKLEVRFRRSKQKLSPEGGTSGSGRTSHDNLGFRDPDQNPFYEPTQELSFLGRFDADRPWFSVELLPTAEHERFRWNFFVLTDGSPRLVSVAASAEGLIDPQDQTKSQPDPDNVDRKILRTIPGIVDRRLDLPGRVANAFDSSLYHNQIERQTKAGPQLLKDNTRVMLSVPILQPGETEPLVAAVSFAVNSLGELAQIDRTANGEEILVGKTKEVLLPLADLEDIKLIADRNPPPEGAITVVTESPDQKVAISTDVDLDGKLQAGQKVKISGTRSYDGVYSATAVEDGSFEIAAVFSQDEKDQGYWEVIEDQPSGLVFENMIATYERTETGNLKISCLSHNLTEGDEIRISGSTAHDGIHPIVNVDDDNSFELDRVWPTGEVVNLSRRPRRGLAFDGKGDYLRADGIQSAPHYSNARLERTVGAWVNLAEITDQPQTIFSTKSGLIHLSADRAGKTTLEVRFADGHQVRVTDPEPLPTGTWIHLTAMIDYQGETDGATNLTLCRGGVKVAEAIVEPRKPLHLPVHNLRIRGQALPITTVQYGMSTTEAITMEAWITTNKTGRQIVSSWNQNGNFQLGVTGDRSNRVVEWATNGQTMTGTIHLSNDDWHHIAGTFDPKTGITQILVGGELDRTGSANSDPSPVEATTAMIGDARATKHPLWIGYLGAKPGTSTVSGHEVTAVSFDGGGFRQVGARSWREVNRQGEPIGNVLVEHGRDDRLVRLRDEADTYGLEINLGERRVDRIDFNVKTDIAPITVLQRLGASTAVTGERRPNNMTPQKENFRRIDDQFWEIQDVDHWNGPGAWRRQQVDAQDDTMVILRSVDGVFGPGQMKIKIDFASQAIYRLSSEDWTPISHMTLSITQQTGGWKDVDAGEPFGRIVHAGGHWQPRTGGDIFRHEGASQQWVHSGSGSGIDSHAGSMYQVARDDNTLRLKSWFVPFPELEFDLEGRMIRQLHDVHRVKLHDIDTSSKLSADPSPDDRFDGSVADVRVWNRPRSASQVQRYRTTKLTGTERNLVAHWPLAETSSAEIADLTKSMAHIRVGSDAKAVWMVEPHRAPGQRAHYDGRPYEESAIIAAQLDDQDRHALELDGAGRGKIPSFTADLSEGFAVAAWVRPDQLTGQSGILELSNAADENGFRLSLGFEENGTIQADAPSGSVLVPGPLTLERWTHIALVVNGRIGALYVDGVATTTGPITSPAGSERFTQSKIGDGFQGGIRDVQLWGRPLDPTEVKYYMNTAAQGTEAGLLHHWPMRTATIKGKKRIVDQGIASSRHVDLIGSAEVVKLTDSGPPTPLTELRGKVSDVQLWTVNRPVETIRRTMHDQLTGNEYGLAGYWRCGGILTDETSEPVTRISPDFAADGHDATVVGDTYVSARQLDRSNSVGKAVKFSNHDLVAVSQRGRYQETFEFRAQTFAGDHLLAGSIENADGRNNPLFEFSYWGQKSRTSKERIDITVDQSYDFIDVGDGWFRAKADVTIPDGVNLIRSFEIDQVTGLWGDEDTPPQNEWMMLEIRKHRLELISDSITRRQFGDTLELPTLLENASDLERSIRDIPALERRLARTRSELSEVLESLLVFSQQSRYQAEKTALAGSTAKLKTTIADIERRLAEHQASPVRKTVMLTVAGSALVVDLPYWHKPYLFPGHGGANQAWNFEEQASGHFRIANHSRPGQYLQSEGAGQQPTFTEGNTPAHRWILQDMGRSRYRIKNLGDGLVLDAADGSTAITTNIISWPYHGGDNQLFGIASWLFGGDKPSYGAEQARITKPLAPARSRLAVENTRLTWLIAVLADLSDDKKVALEAKRDRLKASLVDMQREINGLNTEYVNTAEFAGKAQTMALVAEDPLGLKTYGAILGFASPATGLTSAATAEGNVQLSYFDNRGRMRFSNYDATSDSTNAAYEQWLPNSIAVCPEFGRQDSKLTLDQNTPINMGNGGQTVEAWFYYPPPVQDSSQPYPVSQFTSDADGTESAIAIADGKRLGSVADGFFHDAGIDLSVEVSTGWHHVAKTSSGEFAQYFLDGEPIGHDQQALTDIDRYAATFAGGSARSSSSKAQLTKPIPATAFDNGFTMQSWVRWDKLGNWSPIIDFGNRYRNNLYVSNRADSPDLRITVYHGGTNAGTITAPGVIPTGKWINVAATLDGETAVLYINGLEAARGRCPGPESVERSTNYLGLSNWWNTEYAPEPFAGELADLRIWSRALSAPEIRQYAYDAPPSDTTGLLYHFPMKLKEVDGRLLLDETVNGNHATPDEVTSRQLSPKTTKPVAVLGNSTSGGAPAGRLAEMRFWSTELSDEEIRVHSRIHLSGNEPELEAYYRLDDIIDVGATAADATGRHRPAALEGAGPIARTANIGSPGHHVAVIEGSPVPAITLPQIPLANSSFTIEFWVKRANGGQMFPIRHGRTAVNQGLHIGFVSNTVLRFGFWGNDLDATPANMGVNRWVHIAASYDSATRSRTLFVDGVQQSTGRSSGHYTGAGDLIIGGDWVATHPFSGQISELRIWNHARTAARVADGYRKRVTGTEAGLRLHLPMDEAPLRTSVADSIEPVTDGLRLTRSDDLPLVPGPSLVTAEYSTVGIDPSDPNKQRAILRRFLASVDIAGRVDLLPGKKIEELELKWIGNAQFEPTLLGYMEGAPPVPSENLTINYDYDSATSVELVQSDEVSYTWNRNREVANGLDINTFLGAAWSVSGGAFIETKLTEGHAGVRGTSNTQWRDSQSSMIKAGSTESARDRLDLRGGFEIEPKFPHLGNRYVPKNVGYALVVSGLADVFITRMKRTGRMVAYEVLPVEDMPPDINTITFLLNPAYTMNGSLDGLVGSHAADSRFYRHVPEMRAQYGSRYPASYFNLKQAYDLKAQIERWDKQRESYFLNFDAKEIGVGGAALDGVPDAGDEDKYGQVEIADNNQDAADADSTDGSGDKPEKPKEPSAGDIRKSYAEKGKSDMKATKKRRADIEKVFSDPNKVAEANTAFASWQRRMEGLQVRAGKRNIFNTYVWDADGGMRFEEQSFANTIEHTIGGTFSVNATLGFDGAIQVGGFKGELQAMATHEMSQTISKSQSATRSFELNVRLDGLERKGITDPDDYPIQPGEKVDRYRFMSFYLEGDTDHFTDFFDYVVDPEWLMSNDEEARALRQVARGRPNKTWRVLHRVTYVERPALMGFGRDLRQSDDLASANKEVFNYFDSLEQQNGELRSDIDAISGQLEKLSQDMAEVKDQTKTEEAKPQPTENGGPPPGGEPGPGGQPMPLPPSPDLGTIDLREIPQDGSGGTNGQVVDLNRAGRAELAGLPGVGEEMAGKILELRTSLGRFASVDQLLEVSGIGPAKLAALRPLVTVDATTAV